MSRKPSQDPWGDFWALNGPRGGAMGGGNGCLPQRWAAIEQALSAQWKDFALSIAEDAAVLDLATGDGRVMAWLREVRPDLTCTGIDLSPSLPPAPAGTQTRAGVPMEKLPFDDGSMGAVISQFGFEYGDVPKVAAEIARVLTQAGRVGLIVHRGDGPILEHNKQRRTELMWALKEKGAARKIRATLKGGPAAIDKAAEQAGKIAEQGAKRFGQSSPGWEIPEAIKRSCVMGRSHGVESILDTIATIEGHAMNEIGRINSLAGACASADKRGSIEKAFAVHGLKPGETRALSEPSGRAFADFLSFS